jgi:hypothetical protein
MLLGSHQAAGENLALCQTGGFPRSCKGLAPHLEVAAPQGIAFCQPREVPSGRLPLGFLRPIHGSISRKAMYIMMRPPVAREVQLEIPSRGKATTHNRQIEKTVVKLNYYCVDFDTVRKELTPTAPSVIGLGNWPLTHPILANWLHFRVRLGVCS